MLTSRILRIVFAVALGTSLWVGSCKPLFAQVTATPTARELFREGHWQAALQELQAVEVAELSAAQQTEHYFLRAELLAWLERFDDALEALQQGVRASAATAEDPYTAMRYSYLRSLIALRFGDPQEARSGLKKAGTPAAGTESVRWQMLQLDVLLLRAELQWLEGLRTNDRQAISKAKLLLGALKDSTQLPLRFPEARLHFLNSRISADEGHLEEAMLRLVYAEQLLRENPRTTRQSDTLLVKQLPPYVFQLQAMRGMLLLQAGAPGAARQALDSARTGFTRTVGESYLFNLRTINYLGLLAAAAGEQALANQYFAKVYQAAIRHLPLQHPYLLELGSTQRRAVPAHKADLPKLVRLQENLFSQIDRIPLRIQEAYWQAAEDFFLRQNKPVKAIGAAESLVKLYQEAGKSYQFKVYAAELRALEYRLQTSTAQDWQQRSNTIRQALTQQQLAEGHPLWQHWMALQARALAVNGNTDEAFRVLDSLQNHLGGFDVLPATRLQQVCVVLEATEQLFARDSADQPARSLQLLNVSLAQVPGFLSTDPAGLWAGWQQQVPEQRIARLLRRVPPEEAAEQCFGISFAMARRQQLWWEWANAVPVWPLPSEAEAGQLFRLRLRYLYKQALLEQTPLGAAEQPLRLKEYNSALMELRAAINRLQDTPTPTDLRNRLASEKEALVCYWATDSLLFVNMLRQGGAYATQLEHNGKLALYARLLPQGAATQDRNTYTGTAFRLWELLWQPLVGKLPEPLENVWVVAGSTVNEVPFGLLLSSSRTLADARRWPYLTKFHRFGYILPTYFKWEQTNQGANGKRPGVWVAGQKAERANLVAQFEQAGRPAESWHPRVDFGPSMQLAVVDSLWQPAAYPRTMATLGYSLAPAPAAADAPAHSFLPMALPVASRTQQGALVRQFASCAPGKLLCADLKPLFRAIDAQADAPARALRNWQLDQLRGSERFQGGSWGGWRYVVPLSHWRAP